MWQYQLDEDHFYDLRELPVGGWSGAKISYKANGNWLSFSTPNRATPFNVAHPIDFSKRYVPPKKNLSHALNTGRREAVAEPEFVVTARSLSDMNEEDAIRNPPLKIEEPPTIRNRTATIRGTLRDRAISQASRRPRTMAVRSRGAGIVQMNMVVMENGDLPDQEATHNRCVGTDPYRPPFRVSQVTLRKEFKAAMKAEQEQGVKSRSATAIKPKRPATTMSARVPFITDLYGDY